jgi:hypothetical protein
MRIIFGTAVAILAFALHAAGQTTRPATRPASLSEEEWAAINPPPISINIVEANAAELGAALSKATGKQIAVSPVRSAAGRSATYTLTADQQPFWEVFLQLHRQHQLSAGPGPMPRPNGDPADMFIFSGGEISPIVQTRPSYVARQKNVVRVGGVLIYWPSLQSLAPTSPGRLAFSYTIAVDPRIRVSLN